MNLLQAAAIAKYSYNDLPFSVGTARIKVNGVEVKYNYEFLSNKNSQCYVLEDSHDLIFAIRGSEELKDYLDALKVSTVDMPNVGKVHAGYYEGFKELYGKIDRMIKATSKKVYFIGHSLGGSVSKLFGLHYRDDDVTVITFGEAKSCKRSIKSSNAEFFRVTNNLDVVPRLHIRYSHGVKDDTHIYFSSTGKEVINPSKAREFADVMVSLCLSWFSVIFAVSVIEDHSIDSYIRLLS